MSESDLPVPYEAKPGEQENAPPTASEESFRKCPFCKEQILAEALKCKHCGSVLVPIAENFTASTSENRGNNIQIVTNPPPTNTHSGYTVSPPPNSNTMLGHGWSVLMVALLFSAMSGGNDAEGVVILGTIIVAPWAVWLLSKPSANKILPAIALILMTVMFIGVVG